MNSKTKRIFSILFFALIVAISFVSCGAECAEHKDLDKNGLCDSCGVALGLNEDPVCEHNDADGDESCDSCGAPVEKNPDACARHKDADRDGKCDLCDQSVENALMLVNSGKSDYRIVVADNVGSKVIKAVEALILELRSYGIIISRVDETEPPSEKEILVGDVSSRGDECRVDLIKLGLKGYSVSAVESSILLVGGSDDYTVVAVEAFCEMLLGERGGKIKDLAFYPEDSVYLPQSDYRIKSLSVMGEDLADFTVAVDKTHKEALDGAEYIRDTIFAFSGYWLEIVDIADADRSIILEVIPKSGNEGFYVRVSKGEIRLSSEFYNDIGPEACEYFDRKIKLGSGDVNFTEASNVTKNIRDVTYKRFGAKGDGKTDDFAAIIAAHAYANAEAGHVVYADPGATYYIGNNNGEGHFNPAIVKTDTFLSGAKFIIDDSLIDKDHLKGGVYARQNPIFSINPSRSSVKVTGKLLPASLMKSETNIGYAPGYKAVVLIVNQNHRNYIRYGANENSGQYEQEVVLVDADGNIDPTTPLMWDYETVSYYTVYYADDAPITFSGGEFITVYNQAKNVYEPYSRGIWVYRSNVTVRDLTHRNTKEGDTGCPSGGIVIARNCYNTVVDNVEVDAPKGFTDANAGVGMGSYELSAKHCIDITWQNCTQIDFWADEAKTRARSGGMHATNHCKNLAYINNTLSSFDSHTGAHNITVKGCEIEHINCIGSGEVLIEDTVVHGMYQKAVIILRADYGSLWMGNVTFKNVTLKVGENRSAALMKLNWANHNFGYKCCMPTNVYVDNFTLESTYPFDKVSICNFQGTDTSAWKFWNDIIYDPATGEEIVNKNPYAATERLYIKNNRGRYNFTLLPDMPTEIIDLGDD